MVKPYLLSKPALQSVHNIVMIQSSNLLKMSSEQKSSAYITSNSNTQLQSIIRFFLFYSIIQWLLEQNGLWLFEGP